MDVLSRCPARPARSAARVISGAIIINRQDASQGSLISAALPRHPVPPPHLILNTSCRVNVVDVACIDEECVDVGIFGGSFITLTSGW